MVILHSYVSLPEGSVSWDSKRILLLIGYFSSGVTKHGRCEIHELNGALRGKIIELLLGDFPAAESGSRS